MDYVSEVASVDVGPQRRRLLAIGIVAVLVTDIVALAVHRDGTTPRGSVAQVLAAAGQAAAAGTARIEVTVQAGGGGQSVTIGATGVVALGPVESGDVAFRGPGLARPLHVLVQGSTGYLEVPPSSLGATGGKHWLRFPAPAASSATPDPLSDPLGVLRSLGAGQSVQPLGSAVVRGVGTTRYRVVVDVARAVTSAAPDGQAALRQLLGLGVRSYPVDLWIDAQGRPRRLQFRLSVAGDHVTATIDLYDYGIPVQITLPPGDDTRDSPSEQAALSLVAAAVRTTR